MVYGAIDLHMRYSQIRIVDEDGAVLRDQRIVTSRERLTAGVRRVRADADPARDRDRERVGRAGARGGRPRGDRRRSELRADVWRADSAQVKTDRRDVAALAEANRRGWYRAAHRASAAQRETKQILRTRRLLVQHADRRGAVCCARCCGKRAIASAPAAARRCPRALARLALPAALARDAGAAVPPDRGADDRDCTRSMRGVQTRTASDRDRRAVAQRAGRRADRRDDVSRLRRSPSSGFAHAGQVSARDRAWCRAKTVPPSAAIAATLPKPGRASCAVC